MKNDGGSQHDADTPQKSLPATDIKSNQAKKQKKSTPASNKTNNEKKKSFKKSWRATSPVKKIEIVVLALAAAGGLGYFGVAVWGNLQTQWNFKKENRPDISIARYEIIDIDMVSRRAMLRPEFTVGKPLFVNIIYDNVGKSSALNVEVRYHVVFGKDVAKIIKAESPGDTKTGETIPHGGERMVTAISLKDTYSRTSVYVNPADYVNWDGSKPVVIFGRISYEDADGTPYCAPFMLDRVFNSQNWAHATVGNLSESDMCPQGER
jgi:hypothetical protein